MTHGTQKSDSRIVPAKRANKAAHAAAEPVEGRRGTAGNVEAQSTDRTQSRDAVSQARSRIRAAITRNKTERLTALMHHITVDALRHAFFTLKKRAAAPGVASMMRWTRSRLESKNARSGGFLTPTSARSSTRSTTTG